jgi:hypothetical protein
MTSDTLAYCNLQPFWFLGLFFGFGLLELWEILNFRDLGLEVSRFFGVFSVLWGIVKFNGQLMGYKWGAVSGFLRG